jgi:Protein of unknown function (DUF3102)
MARARKRSAEERLAEGERLLKMKAAIPRKAWLKWLKANTNYSVGTAQRYMREARQATQPKPDLSGAWADADMRQKFDLISKHLRMFEAMIQRVVAQDQVMKRRGQAPGSYSYV